MVPPYLLLIFFLTESSVPTFPSGSSTAGNRFIAFCDYNIKNNVETHDRTSLQNVTYLEYFPKALSMAARSAPFPG